MSSEIKQLKKGIMITNRSNLPAALVNAMKNDLYDKGDSDFTATGLIKPVRIAKLEKIHEHEISEDVEDGLYRLYGQVAHGILERANDLDLAEKRFFATFRINGKDYKVSAQLDTLSLSDGVLSDFKFTTSWGFKANSPPKPEWVAQLNIQLELLRQNGLDAKSLQIVGLLRDWQINSAKADVFYPQAPVAIQPIVIWSREQTVSFIKMRIVAHLTEELPECDEGERWTKPHTWAVIKRGGKRAIPGGVLLSEELAQAICAQNPGTYVQFRHGENTRCENYCKVSQFCAQFQRLKVSKPSEEESA